MAHFYTVYEGSNLSFSLVFAAGMFSCVRLDWGYIQTTVPLVNVDPNWPVAGFNTQPTAAEQTDPAYVGLLKNARQVQQVRQNWEAFPVKSSRIISLK